MKKTIFQPLFHSFHKWVHKYDPQLDNSLNEDELFAPVWRRTLPDYGVSYFNHLISEYSILPQSKADCEIDKTVRRILRRARRKELCWSDIYTFEKIILSLQPDERIKNRLVSLRSKHRFIVGEDAYTNHFKLNSLDLNDKNLDIKVLKAQMEQMLDDFHWAYTITPACERQRNNLNKWVGWIAVGSILIILFASVGISFYRFQSWVIPSLAMVLIMGILGGFVSVQRRIQSIKIEGDPLIGIFIFQRGTFSIYVAPITAAIFAAILYLLFIGGLVKGSIFPAISTSDVADSNSILFGIFQVSPISMNGAEFAKLLVWSFIAGFAERFVPDTLDRLVGKNINNTTIIESKKAFVDSES